MTNVFKFCPLCGGELKFKPLPFDEIKRLTCKECSFIFYRNPSPTVLAIIERGDKILLVKRAIKPYKGYWDLPGGFLEIDQNLESALKREIKEELGVVIKEMKFFGSFSSKYQIKGLKEDIVCTCFKVDLESENFKPGSDVTQVRWFKKDKLPRIVPQKDVQKAFHRLLSRSV